MRMPAEFEKQSATWLAFPHNEEDWPDKFGPVPWAYAEFVRLVALTQQVKLLVKNKAHEKSTLDVCERANVNMANVTTYVVPTDRGWMRDCGPIYVYEGKKKLMLDWGFTGWAKYDNHKADDKVPAALAKKEDAHIAQPTHKGKRVVLEGGSIDVNGKGTLLTTQECLLAEVQQVRNPGFTRKDYEAVFDKYLGAGHVIWLGKGIVGDDTHGHVDDITRFVDASTVVTVVEKDKHDENHDLLKDNVKRLKAARDQSGKQLNVVELPMPRPVVCEGQRLPASYANFLICNQVVLVPTFNDVADRVALSTLAQLFPKRDVIGVHAVDLVWGLGTLHCLSQQEPA